MLWLTLILSAPVILGGQSTALALAPRLALYQPVIGVQRGATPIAYWDADAEGGRELAQAIRGHADAVGFVWCQGESDAVAPEHYRAALTALIRRVRALTRAHLPVRLCELGPLPLHNAIKTEMRAYVRTDPFAQVIPTVDLPFLADQIHLTDAGYDLLAQRIRRSLR